MNSDNYTFEKSSQPQSVDMYTPYESKQWNFVPDINSGVYTPSNTMVQFDLSQIYNSGQFTDTSDLFLTIPIVMQAAFATSAGVILTPVQGHSSLLALKNGFHHLVHQLDITCGGKTISDAQPFTNVLANFKLISQMSQNDLKQWGVTYGFSPYGLDNEKSVQWRPNYVDQTGAAASMSQGLGLINNRIFNSTAIASDYQTIPGVQNSGSTNLSLLHRATKLPDASQTAYATPSQSGSLTYGGSFNNIYGSVAAAGTTAGSIMSADNLGTEAKGYYTVIGNSMVWMDTAILPLRHVCDALRAMGLTKRLDMTLRVYLNTGTLGVEVGTVTATPVSAYGKVTSNTFVNTVPFTINGFGSQVSVANGAVPDTAVRLACALSIGRSNGLTVPSSAGTIVIPAVSHYLPSCRCYYSLVKLEPSRQLAFIEENRAKTVVYENVLYNQFNSIPVGTFSQLVQSGIRNPIGICMIPLISGTTVVATTGAVTLGSLVGEQFQNPYDTCPGTYSPVSLTNLQVALGGVNQLQSSLLYSFENFVEQVGLAETLTSTDLGIGCGLISEAFWNMNRVYYVDLARGRAADKESMRNLTISFTNNSKVPITLMVFTIYLDKLVLDVETGAIRK